MADAPEMPEHLLVYWTAYEELSSCRQYAGMSGVPTAIPWTAISEYAIRHRFAGEAFDDLVTIVREMDRAYLNHAREQIEEQSGQPQ